MSSVFEQEKKSVKPYIVLVAVIFVVSGCRTVSSSPKSDATPTILPTLVETTTPISSPTVLPLSPTPTRVVPTLEPGGLASAQEAMFRGDLQHTGIYNTQGVPVFHEVMWSFKTKSKITSSPAVAGGVVYFGSWDGGLYAVDVRTGQEIWKFVTEAPVHSSPAVISGTGYFGGLDGNFYAVDARTGRENWKSKTSGTIESSPVVADGLVYFGSSDGNLYALDAQTGRERWRFKTQGVVISSPAIVDDVVYFGSANGIVYGLDMHTGLEKWKYLSRGRAIFSSPLVLDETVYFGSLDGNLYAVDIQTGHEKWIFKTQGWSWSSAVVVDETIYFGSQDDVPKRSPERNFYAVDILTGHERWRISTDNRVAFGGVQSSPAIADNIVYFGDLGGNLYAVETQTGRLAWTYKVQADIISPTVAAGQPEWKLMPQVGIESSPVIADGVVYFGSNDGNLYALR